MRTCPICKQRYSEPPALSRRDNKTEICSVCATQEALEEALHHRKEPAVLWQQQEINGRWKISMLHTIRI